MRVDIEAAVVNGVYGTILRGCECAFSTNIVCAAQESLLEDTQMSLLRIVQCAVTSPQLKCSTHCQDRELVCYDQRPAQPSLRNLEVVEASLATSTPALPS